jgi:hypothetical protein
LQFNRTTLPTFNFHNNNVLVALVGWVEGSFDGMGDGATDG